MSNPISTLPLLSQRRIIAACILTHTVATAAYLISHAHNQSVTMATRTMAPSQNQCFFALQKNRLRATPIHTPANPYSKVFM
jgi:hypothetical protein